MRPRWSGECSEAHGVKGSGWEQTERGCRSYGDLNIRQSSASFSPFLHEFGNTRLTCFCPLSPSLQIAQQCHQANGASVMADIYQVAEPGYMVVMFIFSDFFLRLSRLAAELI